jgi:hypothetical protein
VAIEIGEGQIGEGQIAEGVIAVDFNQVNPGTSLGVVAAGLDGNDLVMASVDDGGGNGTGEALGLVAACVFDKVIVQGQRSPFAIVIYVPIPGILPMLQLCASQPTIGKPESRGQ